MAARRTLIEVIGRFGASLAMLLLMLAAPATACSQQETGGFAVPGDERLAATGIKKSVGKHLTLLTDIHDRSDIDDLITVFDQAVPQWCDHFELKPDRAENWHVVGCVMLDQERFQQAGLLPADLPPFPAGFQREDRLWLFAQPGDYYTRHLLLHEGTHAFMMQFLQGVGPAWYAEGMAEWLALHRWSEGQLQLRYHVRDRDEVPYWGRVKIIRDDFAEGRVLTLPEVMITPNRSFREVRYYAWAWAASEFLGTHPDLKDRFAGLANSVRLPEADFNAAIFDGLAAARRDELNREWQLLVQEMEYGYDVSRARPTWLVNRHESDDGALSAVLAADRSWQRTGIRVQPGDRLDITASGQFVVGEDDAGIWNCQAHGITLEYYRGLPLGQLVATIFPDDFSPSTEIRPIPVGAGSEITFETSGELCLRINESPAHLDDNRGTLSVTIKQVQQ